MNARIIFLGILLLALSAPAQDTPLKLHRLTVFFTNDVHGGIIETKAEFLNPEFPPILGGGASAANIILQQRNR